MKVPGQLSGFSGTGKEEAAQSLVLGLDERMHQPAFPTTPQPHSRQPPPRHQYPTDPGFLKHRTLRVGHARHGTGHITRQTSSP